MPTIAIAVRDLRWEKAGVNLPRPYYVAYESGVFVEHGAMDKYVALRLWERVNSSTRRIWNSISGRLSPHDLQLRMALERSAARGLNELYLRSPVSIIPGVATRVLESMWGIYSKPHTISTTSLARLSSDSTQRIQVAEL